MSEPEKKQNNPKPLTPSDLEKIIQREKIAVGKKLNDPFRGSKLL